LAFFGLIHSLGFKSFYSEAFMRDIRAITARMKTWKEAIENSLTS
jgi:hypothetical protein